MVVTTFHLFSEWWTPLESVQNPVTFFICLSVIEMSCLNANALADISLAVISVRNKAEKQNLNFSSANEDYNRPFCMEELQDALSRAHDT